MEQKNECNCNCKKIKEENKRLKQQVKELKDEIAMYKSFIGGTAHEPFGKRES